MSEKSKKAADNTDFSIFKFLAVFTPKDYNTFQNRKKDCLVGDMVDNAKAYLKLNILLFIYSMSGIFSKLASREPFFSIKFILFYSCMILILVIYAIGWQQIIKTLPLTSAYANKAICTIWACIWGVLLFEEELSTYKIIGILLIVCGIVMFTTDGVTEQ